jgi:hypothetical protein
MTAVPFEFYGFPRKPGEDVCEYAERWLAHQKQYRPWEQPAPMPELRLPYREPGEDDE